MTENTTQVIDSIERHVYSSRHCVAIVPIHPTRAAASRKPRTACKTDMKARRYPLNIL